MTKEQQCIIEAAIDEAIEALPNGSDTQLTEWLMEHRFPSLVNDIHEAPADEGFKDLIRDRAREMGVTL